MYKHLRIFFVGSDPRLVEPITKIVKKIGHEIVGTANEADAAFKRILNADPDLILVDFNQETQSHDLTLVKQFTKRLNLPIILLTNSLNELTIREVKKLGHYGIVTKPVSDLELKTEINFTFERFEKLQKAQKSITNQDVRDTEQFFEQVVNNVSDIIYRLDASGKFTYLNPSAIATTGYEKEELYQSDYKSLVRLDYRRKCAAQYERMVKRNISNQYIEIPVIVKSGNEIWLGQNVHLLRRGKKISGFQVVARDITKEILYKEELINARKSAEQASELKAQFLANMSHEIRTPLNGIVGIVKLLEKTPMDGKQQNYLRAIVSSSNQLMGIINDILDLSKIDSGKMEINTVSFDLEQLLHSLVEVMEIKASMSGIQIVFELGEKVPKHIIGDPVILNQILYNLIGNSLKFTQKGTVFLTVNLLDKEADGKIFIDFTVRDTGIGMRGEVLERIFDAFTQAENSTIRQFGGTGLGLTIVKKLVTLHGGQIWVDSEVGIGSTFTVRLSYEKCPDGEETNSSVTLNIAKLDAKSILLVEDNFINQMVTRDLLEDCGVEVVIAENGKIALEILHNKSFDAILMDMQMPVLDGFETMKRIRRDAKFSDIPILALTANATRSEYEKCIAFGASDYLSKPFLPEDLFEKIVTMFNEVSVLSENEDTELNIELLNRYTNGKKTLMVSTLTELSQVMKKERKELNILLEGSDLKGLRSRMHRLKSNFLLIGLNELVTLAEGIEIGQTIEEVKYKTDLLKDKMGSVEQKVIEVRDELSRE